MASDKEMVCCFIDKLFFQNLKYVFLRIFRVCLGVFCLGFFEVFLVFLVFYVVMMDKVPWPWFTKALKYGLKSPGEHMADKESSLAV